MAEANIDNQGTFESSSDHQSKAMNTKISQEKGQSCDVMKASKKARRLSEFYENKNILITGSTGFIGKICLFKIINSLGNCGNVYVLLRSKKGVSPQQRFNKMLNEEPFTKTMPKSYEISSNNKENFVERDLDWSRVIAVEGDMSCEDLGFCQETKEKICKNVDIIFNIAASVQFDAPLKQNLRDNYIGARNLLQLATKVEKLISLVHVSTFYTNSHISHVEEKVLPMNRDCEKMAELISWIPDSLCDTIGPQIMENRPNTYIFTKAMSENLVQKYQGQLPIAIVRPSIVTPSIRDPIPGWVDNVNGPMGLGVLASLGILRNIDWNYDGVSDVIPVDFVVNTMLSVAERTPRLYGKEEIKVYNCSSSSLNPQTWGYGFEVLREESLKAPPYKMLRIPIKVPNHKRANKLIFSLTKLSELLFAYFIDFILMLCGQKRLLARLTAKLHHGYEILRPFTTTEYTCSNDNLISAFEELNDEDKKVFDFDVRQIDWKQSYVDSYYGTRKRLLKEDMSNVEAAKKKMKVLYVVEFVFRILIVFAISVYTFKFYGYLTSNFLQQATTSSSSSSFSSAVASAKVI